MGREISLVLLLLLFSVPIVEETVTRHVPRTFDENRAERLLTAERELYRQASLDHRIEEEDTQSL